MHTKPPHANEIDVIVMDDAEDAQSNKPCDWRDSVINDVNVFIL